MAECILMKNGGGVGSDELTASASNVLSGKTYVGSDTNDDIGTGTMPNNGTVSKTLDINTTSQTIALGYHNGNGKVQISPQAKTAYATTSAQNINADNGKVLSRVTIGAISQANLSAANIKKGVNVRVANGSSNVYNVTGTHTIKTVGTISYANSESEKKILTRTLDVRSALGNYASLSASDFAVGITSTSGWSWRSTDALTFGVDSVTYNASTGILTVTVHLPGYSYSSKDEFCNASCTATVWAMA